MAVRRIEYRSAPFDAVVDVPGSKSIANRALICAALADGETVLHHVPDGDDTAAMLDCLERLGFGIERADPSTTRSGPHVMGGGAVRVFGGPTRMTGSSVILPTRLAGTTSRFVTALAALGSRPVIVDGAPPLRTRPMGPLHDALAELGATVVPDEIAGQLPVSVHGPLTGSSAALEMPGDVSSQFLTALMLIGPYVPGGLTIRVTTPLVSRPYLAITVAVMADFGFTDVSVGERDIRVGPGRYVPTSLTVEPDASSASYPLAAAAVCGGRIRVNDLHAGSSQGDAEFADLLRRMGAVVQRDEGGTTVQCRTTLLGIDVDMAAISDLVPTLAVVAAFATSPTTISGVGFIRHKESDRLGDLCRELRRAGIAATELPDGLRIEPRPARSPQTAEPVVLDTYHDHRLAMAFAVLGLGLDGVSVDSPEVVAKSWPGFWQTWAELSASTGPAS